MDNYDAVANLYIRQMKEEILEKIVQVMFWISAFMLVAMLAWWIVGDSPTLEQASTVLAPVFMYFAIKGDINTSRLMKQHKEQMQILKELLEVAKEQKK